MTEFERGIRYVVERTETYTKGSGPAETQFGEYQMSMIPRPSTELSQGSADHRERRVRAMLALASKAMA